jgi:hypothetical protein
LEINISSGGKIIVNKNFSIHPSFNLVIVPGFEGKLSICSPAIIGSFKNNYFLGLSYKDLNKITIHAGAVAFKNITLSAACGISTNTDIAVFGNPAYIGGDLRINLKK